MTMTERRTDFSHPLFKARICFFISTNIVKQGRNVFWATNFQDLGCFNFSRQLQELNEHFFSDFYGFAMLDSRAETSTASLINETKHDYNCSEFK